MYVSFGMRHLIVITIHEITGLRAVPNLRYLQKITGNAKPVI